MQNQIKKARLFRGGRVKIKNKFFYYIVLTYAVTKVASVADVPFNLVPTVVSTSLLSK